MVRDNVRRSVAGTSSHSQGCRSACYAPRSVAHHDAERLAAVGRGRSRGCVTRRCSAGDVGAVFLPLIVERRRARGCDAEGGGLAHCHSLTCWLGIDVGRDGTVCIYGAGITATTLERKCNDNDCNQP